MSSYGRVYRAEIISYPESYEESYAEEAPERWEPEGWREHLAANRPDTTPDEWAPEFRWPNTRRVYLSRSAAQGVVNWLRRWGADAVLVEATPEWEPVTTANARRATARKQSRIAKLRAEIARLEGE